MVIGLAVGCQRKSCGGRQSEFFHTFLRFHVISLVSGMRGEKRVNMVRYGFDSRRPHNLGCSSVG